MLSWFKFKQLKSKMTSTTESTTEPTAESKTTPSPMGPWLDKWKNRNRLTDVIYTMLYVVLGISALIMEWNNSCGNEHSSVILCMVFLIGHATVQVVLHKAASKSATTTSTASNVAESTTQSKTKATSVPRDIESQVICSTSWVEAQVKHMMIGERLLFFVCFILQMVAMRNGNACSTESPGSFLNVFILLTGIYYIVYFLITLVFIVFDLYSSFKK